jgi:hypothetical protein
VSLTKARWTGIDGKEVGSETVAQRLKPGVTVLLSADGAPVDAAYRRLFREDVLVLMVLAEELPVPYLPHVGGGIPIKEVGER